MTLRTILNYPDPRLRTLAKPVTHFDDDLKTLIDDMFETMYAAKGIGWRRHKWMSTFNWW